GSAVATEEAGTEHSRATSSRVAILLYPGVKARLERGRDPVSATGRCPAAGAQRGRSRAFDPGGPDTLSTRRSHDTLCDRGPQSGGGHAQGQAISIASAWSSIYAAARGARTVTS